MVKESAERFSVRPKLLLWDLRVWLLRGQREWLAGPGVVGEPGDQVCVQVGE
jgi:hypothetical protein